MKFLIFRKGLFWCLTKAYSKIAYVDYQKAKDKRKFTSQLLKKPQAISFEAKHLLS